MEKKQEEIEGRLQGKLLSQHTQYSELWRTFSEGLTMHCQDMESEAKKTRNYTDIRCKYKQDQADKTIMEVEEKCKKMIGLIKVEAEEAGYSVKYKLEDFKVQLENRVSKDYI